MNIFIKSHKYSIKTASNQKSSEVWPPLKFNFTYWEVFSAKFSYKNSWNKTVLQNWQMTRCHYDRCPYGPSLTSLIIAQFGQNWCLNTLEFTQQFNGTITYYPRDMSYVTCHTCHTSHVTHQHFLLPYTSGVSKSMFSIPGVQWDYCLSCPVMP